MSDRDDPRVVLLWLLSARNRVLVAVALGAIAGMVVGLIWPWQAAVLVSWDVTAVITVLWIYLTVRRFTPEETQAFASREDDSRFSAQFLLLSASLASLLGVGSDLHKASNEDDTTKVLRSRSVLTAIASWCVVHTELLLPYADRVRRAGSAGRDDFRRA